MEDCKESQIPVDEKLSGDNTKEELINNNNDNNSAVRKRLHR